MGWYCHAHYFVSFVLSGKIPWVRCYMYTTLHSTLFKKASLFLFLIFSFFSLLTQHCFICRPSKSPVSEDAGIEPRTAATTALAVRRCFFWKADTFFVSCGILPEDTCRRYPEGRVCRPCLTTGALARPRDNFIKRTLWIQQFSQVAEHWAHSWAMPD